MSDKADIHNQLQALISSCIDEGDYDPAEDYIKDPFCRRTMHTASLAIAEIERLREELAAWKAVAEKRHNILFDLAWAANVSDDRDSYCLGCDTFKGKEHGGGCVIARAIAQSECAATDAIDPCDGDQEGAT